MNVGQCEHSEYMNYWCFELPGSKNHNHDLILDSLNTILYIN